MTKWRSFLSLLVIVILVSAISKQTVSANWLEGFAFEEIKPMSETENEETTVDPAAEYAAEVLRIVNLERKTKGLTALSGLTALKAAANTRAKEVSYLFAHIRPDGSSPRTVFTENGLKFRRIGENIAHGYSDPKTLVQAWMNSDAHRNVILRAEYTHADLGYYKNEDGKIFCSMLFFTATEG